MPLPSPVTFFPDISRPLRFPRDWLRLLYWVYFRPLTLERYIQQFDATLKLDTSLITLWRKGREHPPLRHLAYLTLLYIWLMPWVAFPLAYIVSTIAGWDDVLWNIVLLGVLWGGVVLGAVWSMLWGVLWGVMWGMAWGTVWGVGWIVGYLLEMVFAGVVGDLAGSMMVVGVVANALRSMVEGMRRGAWRGARLGIVGGIALGVVIGNATGVLVAQMLIEEIGILVGLFAALAVGIAGALSGIVGALRLYEYPFWFLWAGVLGLVDTAGRWLRWSPPFWNEVVALPVPGVGRQVRALLRRDSQAGLAAVQYLAAYRYGWARKVAARVALRFLLESMARARTLQDLAALYRELAPWWRLAPVRAQWGADLVEVLETVTKEAQAALESTTAQESTRHLQEALRAVEQAQQSLSRSVGRALARALQPVLETWQALLRGAVV